MIEPSTQWYSITSFQVIRSFEDVECLLAMCLLHDSAKHRGDHRDVVNIVWVRLKRRRHVIAASRFVLNLTIEGAPEWDVKGNRSNGHRVDGPCDCKYHRTVRVDTLVVFQTMLCLTQGS
ncbi:hypothetical protein TNCV_2140671 [Trichonephila clavipes]|uniref:Uncharacterized protein n=1 Tax=Trichonephila clavipes TaxID=2585209 RepID=A0A8X6RWX5_TRICX|nr:hypothetical protein TNCV_2140671 [Trichonephila clavipes]